MQWFIIYSLKSLRSDILFGVVIFKCLSLAKLYIDYSARPRYNVAITGMAPQRICQQVIHIEGAKKHLECSKWNTLSQHNIHNELIFPSLPFYSVRGDIDIHTSQQALCQFPSLIQICCERSANPLSSAGCEDDSPSCLKRKLQEQYTRGSFLILRDVNAQDILAQFQPNEISSAISLFSFRAHGARRLSGFMRLHTRAWTWACLHGKHTHPHLQYAFAGGVPLQFLIPGDLNLHPCRYT